MAEYEYNVNGTLAKMTYTNSDYVLYSYDLLDRLISEVYYNHNHVAVAEYHYVYNANGQLAKQYVTQNGKVVRDTVTNASTGAFQYILDFTYDESGSPFALRKYTNSSLTSYCTYYYGCNAQGDVVTLFTGNGNIYATYSYDAWGRILASSGTMADVNPLRYRGYYYDTETGFYYLQSRYYDPIVKRFLNADSYGSTGQGFLGFNMFAYCGNNPTNGIDQSGARFVNTMMTDSGGGFIPATCSANYTPDFVQYCQDYGYTLSDGYQGYYEYSVESCVKSLKNVLSKIGGTVSLGFSFSGTFGIWDYNFQIGISIDLKGNIALQKTIVTGITTTDPYATAGGFAMITNAPSVNDLVGLGYQFGGSVSIPSPALTASIGGELNVLDNNNKYYYGVTGLLGITTPGKIVEGHAEWGDTSTIISINIFDSIFGNH